VDGIGDDLYFEGNYTGGDGVIDSQIADTECDGQANPRFIATDLADKLPTPVAGPDVPSGYTHGDRDGNAISRAGQAVWDSKLERS
jgi:hypothetical protein